MIAQLVQIPQVTLTLKFQCALAKKNLNLSKMGGYKIINWVSTT